MTSIAYRECREAYSAPMSKDRKEIYLGEGLRRALKGRRDSLTAAVNKIADRYQAMVEASLPELSAAEWALLEAALNHPMDRAPEAAHIAGLPAIVGHALRRTPGGPELAAKLAGMTLSELVAAVDHLERSGGAQ